VHVMGEVHSSGIVGYSPAAGALGSLRQLWDVVMAVRWAMTVAWVVVQLEWLGAFAWAVVNGGVYTCLFTGSVSHCGKGKVEVRLLTYLAGLPLHGSPLALFYLTPQPTYKLTTMRNDGLHPLLEGRGRGCMYAYSRWV
jgi:hypothetical protein